MANFKGQELPQGYYLHATKERMDKEDWDEMLEVASGWVTDKEDMTEEQKEMVEKAEIKESDYLNDTDQLASTIQEYYKLLAKSSFFFLNTSTLLPISISLKIDGISSLNFILLVSECWAEG